MPFINSILPTQNEESDETINEPDEVSQQESKSDAIKSSSMKAVAKALLTSTSDGLSAIEELKSTMDSIAAAAEESAGASEESLSAVNVIKESSSAILKMSTKSADNIKNLERTLYSAADKVSDSSDNMLKIANSAEDVAALSNRLSGASKEVSQTVELVTKLAKRTSLLALNAAIEASRAEEKGQGFSVIAKEIRTLSSKSNTYAQEIKSVVEEIQKSVKDVEDTIISTKLLVEKSSQNAIANADSMKILTQKLLEITQDVNSSLEEFQLLDNDIIKMQLSSETIASAAEESAGAVSEVTQTIAMQATAFEQSNSAALMLEKLAEKLGSEESADGEYDELASAAEELSSAIEEIENSMAQIMVAFSQIEEAAMISKDDAKKSAALSEEILKIADRARERIFSVNEEIKVIQDSFKENVLNVKSAGVDSKENLKQNESILSEAKGIKKSIKYLKKYLRKIELTIVQTAALSINGSVEAMQVKNIDPSCSEGFSVVSNDIRNLAQNSEHNLDKINDIVDNLEDETEDIIEAIDKMQLFGVKEAEALIALSLEMDESTKKIDESVEMFATIAQQMESIDHAVSEAKIGSEQIKTAAEIAFNNISESKSAAEHIRDLSGDMAENVSSLIEVATFLKDE